MTRPKPTGRSKAIAALRKRAETLLAEGAVKGTPMELSPRLIHELHVYQAELEMQNEELLRTEQNLQISKAALETSLARYRGLYDRAPIGLVSLRADGAILECNLAAATLLGVPRERLSPRSLARLIAPSDHPAFERCRSNHFAAGHGERCEVDLMQTDGTTRRVWIEGVEDSEGGQPVSMGVLLSLVDVTTLRSAEAELRASNANMRAVLDASLDGIVTIDEHGCIQSVNSAIERLLGFSPEELVGQNVSLLMPSPEREEHPSYLERYLRTGEKRIIGIGRDLTGRRKDGKVFPLRLVVTKVTIAGRRQFVGFLYDHSGKQELESQLRAMALEVALAESRERRHLAGDLHDGLGQLLALASMKLGMLRSASAIPEVAGRVREIEALITEAHGQVGALTLQLSPPLLDESDLLASVQWLADDVGRRFGLEVTVDDDGAPKALVEGVRVTLLRALRELLVNVAKHSQTAAAKMRMWHDEDRIHVPVEDEGIGFDTKAEGKGFGLFSARQRLQHVGGSVRIESIPGDDTRVHITLPVSEPGAGNEEGAA